jgi:vacuolar protein sorting-associated protein VTA1
VDIRKALAEGRKPVPGPPVPETDVPDLEETLGTEVSFLLLTKICCLMDSPLDYFSFSSHTVMRCTYSCKRVFCIKDVEHIIERIISTFQGSASTAPETTQQPMSPPQDSPTSEPFYQHSYSKSSEDLNLPSAPSNPIPPSYSQNNSYGAPDNAGYPSHQSPYPHTSGTPFDSLGGNPGPHATIGTYSYPSDPPGFTTSPPPSFNPYAPASQDRQDPGQYHQQQPHWPSSSPFNDPSSAYPSVFPSGGYQPAAPQYPSTPQAPHGASRHSEPLARTSSAPVGPESSTGYQLNGNYDSEYKPSAGTIAEAHKASRFAVSALAFDDVPTAIDYLRKSLELLTTPSATVD